MSKSKIHSVPDAVWRVLSRVDYVDLSENQLTVLPKFLGSENITFRSLSLHDNPLRCTCEDKWIRGWLKSLGKGLVTPCIRYPQAVCSSPDWLKQRNVLELTDDEFCINPYEKLIVEVR